MDTITATYQHFLCILNEGGLNNKLVAEEQTHMFIVNSPF